MHAFRFRASARALSVALPISRLRRSMLYPLAALFSAVFLFVPAGARAQSRPDSAGRAINRRSVDTCYRFAFGSWTPALDLHSAGHDTTARPLPGAAPGRDWASSGDGKGPATLMLYPAWWPAGVMVQLPGGPPALGDTTRGTATALVADARLRSPTATARAWGVVCGR